MEEAKVRNFCRSQSEQRSKDVSWLVDFRMGWYEKRSELIVNHGPVCVYTPHTHPKRNEGEKEMTRQALPHQPNYIVRASTHILKPKCRITEC